MQRRSIATLVFLLLTMCAQAIAAPLPLVWRQSIVGTHTDGCLGTSVAMDGELMAIGAPDVSVTTAQGTFERTGLVEIRRWVGGAWQLQYELDLTDFDRGPQDDARFGAALAVSGNRVLIGCPGCAFLTPHAYLVEFSDGQPEPVMWYPMSPSFGFTDGGSDPMLGAGAAVALSENIFAIGAPTAVTFGDGEPGMVAVGRLQSDGVVWEDTLAGPSDPNGARFGQAVALAKTVGETLFDITYSLVVGAPAYVNSGGFGLAGRAYLYKRGAFGGWSLSQQFANPNPGLADGLGLAVAIEQTSDDTVGAIVLGAPGRSLAGVPGGSVRIYNTANAGNYVFEREIQHPNATAGDGFGAALALSNWHLLVGAAGRAVDLAVNAGSVYVFDATLTPQSTLDWSQRQVLLPRGNGNAAFGSSLAVGPRAAAIGAPRADATNGADDVGKVDTYLCDRIFANGMENRYFPGCPGP